MKAVLDHVGIAVGDLNAAVAFFRDALGLDVEAPEEVASQRVRVHYVGAGEAALELLEATAADSPVAKFIEKRGPGLHHITLRVENIDAALAHLKSRGVRLIDETPRIGSGGSRIAFVHPASAHGVLVELKEGAPHVRASTLREPQGRPEPGRGATGSARTEADSVRPRESLAVRPEPFDAPFVLSLSKDERLAQDGLVEGRTADRPMARRMAFGDVELISLSDGAFRLDGGAMFGTVPKVLWEARAPADERNRIALGLRPLVVRGARTMLIDAGVGDKMDAKRARIYAFDRARHLDHALAEAGLAPESIDIVLASHLHFDHAGGFTARDAGGRVRPRFPRAQYIVRRGEWEDATAPDERSRAAYLAENFKPLADAGVLQLVDEDATIMPGVRVRRTGGHTRHHQIVQIESKGRTAVFAADLIPTAAHVFDPWIMGYDLYPLETLAFKRRFTAEAIAGGYLIFFEHDPSIAAGYIRETGRSRTVEQVL